MPNYSLRDMNGNPTVVSSKFATYRSVTPILNEDKIIKLLESGVGHDEIGRVFGDTNMFSKWISCSEMIEVKYIQRFRPRTSETPGFSYLYRDGGTLLITLFHMDGNRSNYNALGEASFCVEGKLTEKENKIYLKLS